MKIVWETIDLDKLPLLEEAIVLYDQIFSLDVKEPNLLFLRSLELAKHSFPNTYRFLAGYDEGKQLVSFATGHYLADVNAAFIVYLAAHPEVRNKGLGSKTLLKLETLLNEDANKAGNKSLSSVILETEKRELAHTEEEKENCVKRQRFYERNGYKPFGEISYLQPPLHPSGQALPMTLYVKCFDASHPAKENVQKIIRAMYREKYEFVNGIDRWVLEDGLKRMGMEGI
ncbi:MAG: GNAT family N-acetyltransferase [Bacillota bacterium]|nr:GNAT family N-acetyltransferase [Bacillota bacterium]